MSCHQFHSRSILYLNKIKSIQTWRSQNDIAIFGYTEWQLRQLSFVLFSGLEEEFWCQLKLNEKITSLFYCADDFHFGEKYLILGNFDTTVGKICISRPLGTTLVNGTWLIRQKIIEKGLWTLGCQTFLDTRDKSLLAQNQVATKVI